MQHARLLFFLLLLMPHPVWALNVTMQWTDNSSGTTQEDFWQLEKAPTSGGTYVGFASAGQDAESHTFPVGAPGTTEWYRLRGVNTIGNGAYSTPVSFTVPAAPPVAGFVFRVGGDIALSGIVLELAMNEGTGSTVADTSGRSNNGTITGATWTTSGKYGNALTFDGVDDGVTIASSPSLEITTGVTLAAWVYPTALAGGSSNGYRAVIVKDESTTSPYALLANAETSVPRAYLRINNVDVFLPGTQILPLNTWTHLAATYDGAFQRLYVNGAEVSSITRTGTVLQGAGTMHLGRHGTAGQYFAGRIDEVRVYDRALTPTEIIADRDTPIS